jgi:hypothetical protein
MEIPAVIFEPGLEIRLRHGSNGGFCDEAFEEFCRANPDLRIERLYPNSVYQGFPSGEPLQAALVPFPQWYGGIPPFLGPPLGKTWYIRCK